MDFVTTYLCCGAGPSRPREPKRKSKRSGDAEHKRAARQDILGAGKYGVRVANSHI
jgi:hypothetical protein